MIKGDPDGHFFEDNREFRFITECRRLIEDYGEIQAGKYMWAIWIVYHPDSAIFDMSIEDKVEWVKLEYLKDSSFDWPMPNYEPPPEPEPKKRKKKGEEDIFDVDMLFEDTAVHKAFADVVKVFPHISMSAEERNYYEMVALNEMCIKSAMHLNAKDCAAALTNIARASVELDKIKAKYITWRDATTQTGGQVQSGWAFRKKK